MNPSYNPPPSTPTRLVLPDASKLAGDVSLLLGNNIALTRSGNGVIIAASAPAALRVVSAFAPGAAVARTLLVASADAPVLRTLDVYCGTAPVGVGGGNCANVRVAGSVSGAVVLPISGAGPEYHLGVQDTTTPVAGSLITSANANLDTPCAAVPFRVSTPTVVFNADFLQGAITYGSTGGQMSPTARFGIATGVTGATDARNAAWITDPSGNQAVVTIDQTILTVGQRVLAQFPTTQGFTLVPGTTYWLVLTGLTTYGAAEYRVYPRSMNNAGAATNLGNLIGAPETAVYRTATDTATVLSAQNAATFSNMTFNLYGAVLGTPMAGLITVSQTITGAPPGTTGSDMNIRAQL